MISLCKYCIEYWEDLKYCNEHKKFSYEKEFEKICKDKCFKEKEENNINNMCQFK